jgi:hypothetical protein
MTPFMERVTEAVTGGERAGSPRTRPSAPRPVVIGADEQVMTRALAEQLVSEANAVLASTVLASTGPAAAGEVIDLADELGDARLSFVLRYRARYARVSTSFEHRTSVGHLHGVGAGGASEVTLDGPEQLERLILLLIAEPADKQGGTSCSTSFASR